MPRHRRRSAPRHRALRQAVKSVGRSQVSAAIVARGAARGLVSPWFATAAGVVIAASLWIYYPQAQFRLPASTLGRTSCLVDGCSAGKKPSLATSGGQQMPRHRARRRAAASADAHARKVRRVRVVDYSVFPGWQGSVILRIVLPGRLGSSSHWTLSFGLPGDKIDNVFGASWQQTGADSGTASWQQAGAYSGAGGQPGGDGGSSSGQPGGDGWQGQFGDTTQITVLATGQSTSLTGCMLDGARCVFRFQKSTSGH